MLYVLKKKKKKKKKRAVSLTATSVRYLALTRSYSERWQVARIGLCGRGAVCGVLKI